MHAARLPCIRWRPTSNPTRSSAPCWTAATASTRMIATGGMSAVYRGLDLRLDRPVALKVMDSRYAGDQQFLDPVPARGPRGRAAEGPRPGRRLRPGHRRPASVSGDGARSRAARCANCCASAARCRRTPSPRCWRPCWRPGRRAPRRAGAPRRQAGERADLRRRRGQDRRLRSGARGRRGEDHLDQRDSGHRGLPVARTGQHRRRRARAATSTASASSTYELLTGVTPFTGDSALAVAYQRMDNDVPAAEHRDRRCANAIRRAGAARHRAQSRRPVRRRRRHGAPSCDAIVDELALPDVPGARAAATRRSTLSAAAPAPAAADGQHARRPRPSRPAQPRRHTKAAHPRSR